MPKLHRSDLLVVCGSLVAALPVAAQTQPSERPLEEVVVTATRIEKSLARVPAAITVVGKDDIQLARQQLALDESLSRVPGVFMQNRYNFAQDLRVSIRGFGARAQFGIRGIKIVVDGIPETLPDGQGSVDSIDLGATSQIEVLRGPSSSLWGNASGGVISITTENPREEPYSEIRASAGEYGFEKLQFKTSRQGDRVGYLFSLSDSALDGYRDQSRAENTQLTGRFNIDLGDDRKLLTILNYTDQPVSDDPGGITAAQAAADPTSARDLNVLYDGGENLEQTRVGLAYDMPIGENSHLAARNYYVWRTFGASLPFTDGGIVDLDRFFAGGGVSYTVDSDWGGHANQLIVGLDIERQDDDRLRYDNLTGTPGALTFDQNETVKSTGLFVQDDLSLTERLELTFGARWDQVEFDVTDRFLADGNDSGDVTLDDVSPMAGIVYLINDHTSFYGNYSTAFETPTTTEFNKPDGTGGFNASLNPQFATNLEVGVRGTIANRHRYEAALFNIEVDDELIPYEVPSSPGRDYYQNAGQSTRNGIELSFQANPTDRISATFAYTYSDFTFDKFVDAGLNDYSNNVIPGIAEDVFFAEFAYKHERGWYGILDMTYTGDQYANNSNSVLVDPYVVANLRFGLDKEVGSVTLSPFIGVSNLFDETYYSNIRINAFGGRFFEPAPPRNGYLGISVGFSHR